MSQPFVIRFRHHGIDLLLTASLEVAGSEARTTFDAASSQPGIHLFLSGDRPYYATLGGTVDPGVQAALEARVGKRVSVVFPGRNPVRRILRALSGTDSPASQTSPKETSATRALDLTAGLEGAPPLFLHASGELSTTSEGLAPQGFSARDALVTAARWVSSRRSTSFERLFPPSAFHPDSPLRPERLTLAQAEGLLHQVESALQEAAVGSAGAEADPLSAAEIRSACVTLLSHVLATSLRDSSYRPASREAAESIFALIQKETSHPTARAELRAHAIRLLQMRAPALDATQKTTALSLLASLTRESPPYADLPGPWHFAATIAWDFLEGICEILLKQQGFIEIPLPADAPSPPSSRLGSTYRVFQARWKTPDGQPVQIFARSARPTDENWEMTQSYFAGLFINRHAQLGAFDMQASSISVIQRGYKLMLNAQCAGLTTRFALSRMFPDADIYSSWDSTFFRTGEGGKVTASEGLDCFIEILKGMCHKETHSQFQARIRKAQWYHPQASTPEFVQFIGPSHPQVAARYSDINNDGKADYYDGYLDFRLVELAEDLRASLTSKDPQISASQVGGEAARGLGWAAGSLNRVTQYSDLWDALQGDSENLYVYQAGGFYSHQEPPQDVPTALRNGLSQDLSRLPSVCRYTKDSQSLAGLSAEVMFHSFLSHTSPELKRLLCAAEAFWRAIDLGYLAATGSLSTPLQQRGAVLLTLAGLLEFPADQNQLDGVWSMALQMLHFPDISRTVVRKCITDADHQASNYYGSKRGIAQLVGDSRSEGALQKADALAWERLRDEGPETGRAVEWVKE